MEDKKVNPEELHLSVMRKTSEALKKLQIPANEKERQQLIALLDGLEKIGNISTEITDLYVKRTALQEKLLAELKKQDELLDTFVE